MTLRLRHGCNSVSLLVIRLITLLWRVVAVVDIILEAEVVQVGCFLIPHHCLLAQLIQSQSGLVVRAVQQALQQELMAQLLQFLQLSQLMWAAAVAVRLIQHPQEQPEGLVVELLTVILQMQQALLGKVMRVVKVMQEQLMLRAVAVAVQAQ
jgi:hypothetical protein